MALYRIKNPEQLKQYKPGKLGRIIGLDHVPELRKKIKELVGQNHCKELMINCYNTGDNGCRKMRKMYFCMPMAI